jgi:hypothetical protein
MVDRTLCMRFAPLLSNQLVTATAVACIGKFLFCSFLRSTWVGRYERGPGRLRPATSLERRSRMSRKISGLCLAIERFWSWGLVEMRRSHSFPLARPPPLRHLITRGGDRWLASQGRLRFRPIKTPASGSESCGRQRSCRQARSKVPLKRWDSADRVRNNRGCEQRQDHPAAWNHPGMMIVAVCRGQSNDSNDGPRPDHGWPLRISSSSRRRSWARAACAIMVESNTRWSGLTGSAPSSRARPRTASCPSDVVSG